MFLKTAEAVLFVTDCGPTGANTLVAHGGWVGSGELWLQPFEQLSRRWRCITYDHRGTGATRHRGGPIVPQMLVDDLFRVLDALKIERCILAGESMGGVTVLQAALQAPERFSGLVLIGARYQGQLSEGAQKLVAGCAVDFPATMKAFVTACAPEEDCEAEREWALQIVMRSNPQDASQLLQCMGEVDLAPQLREIRVPTLIIHGRRDVIRPIADSEFLHASIAGSRLVAIDDAGHVPSITRPTKVATEIDAFFA